MKPERKAVRPLILSTSLIFLMLVAVMSAPAFTEEAMTRHERGGGVMISLTYLNPAHKAPAGKIAFMLRMNTQFITSFPL